MNIYLKILLTTIAFIAGYVLFQNEYKIVSGMFFATGIAFLYNDFLFLFLKEIKPGLKDAYESILPIKSMRDLYDLETKKSLYKRYCLNFSKFIIFSLLGWVSISILTFLATMFLAETLINNIDILDKKIGPTKLLFEKVGKNIVSFYKKIFIPDSDPEKFQKEKFLTIGFLLFLSLLILVNKEANYLKEDPNSLTSILIAVGIYYILSLFAYIYSVVELFEAIRKGKFEQLKENFIAIIETSDNYDYDKISQENIKSFLEKEFNFLAHYTYLANYMFIIYGPLFLIFKLFVIVKKISNTKMFEKIEKKSNIVCEKKLDHFGISHQKKPKESPLYIKSSNLKLHMETFGSLRPFSNNKKEGEKK